MQVLDGDLDPVIQSLVDADTPPSSPERIPHGPRDVPSTPAQSSAPGLGVWRGVGTSTTECLHSPTTFVLAAVGGPFQRRALHATRPPGPRSSKYSPRATVTLARSRGGCWAPGVLSHSPWPPLAKALGPADGSTRRVVPPHGQRARALRWRTVTRSFRPFVVVSGARRAPRPARVPGSWAAPHRPSVCAFR
jgi:hypothetical protein